MSWLSWACLWESILSTVIDIEDLAYKREHYALGLNPGLEKRRRAESKHKGIYFLCSWQAAWVPTTMTSLRDEL